MYTKYLRRKLSKPFSSAEIQQVVSFSRYKTFRTLQIRSAKAITAFHNKISLQCVNKSHKISEACANNNRKCRFILFLNG